MSQYLVYLLQEIVKNMSPQVIASGNALKLRARQELTDKDGAPRYTGEEWLVREIGAYLPGVMEEVCVCVCGHLDTKFQSSLLTILFISHSHRW